MELYFCHIRWFSYFFSHMMVSSSHYAIPTSHMTVLLSHSVVPLFFLTFDGTILILCSTNITCDCTFVKSVVLFFFLTFDGSIVTLGSTNITYDRTFLTFAGTLIFSSHLTISLSHWAVPTSYVTVLLSHSIVPLFFSLQLMVSLSH